MSIFTGLITLLTITYCSLPSTSESQKISNGGQDSHVDVVKKRALPGLIPFLLKTAKLKKSSKSLSEYNKPGGYKQAAKDFYYLGPKVKVDRQTFKWGLVGDKQVIFQFRHNQATLRIRDQHSMDQVTKIKYTD